MLFGQIYGNLSQKHLFTFSNTLEKDMQLCYNICVSISEDGGCIMTFAEKVKEARKPLGLSQEKFAGQMGVSFSTINRWEKGRFLPSYLAQAQFDSFCKDNGIVFNDTGERE